MDLKLNNKTALITGASKGIGFGISEIFASEGVNLFLTARSENELKALKSKLTELYRIKVEIIPLDITASESTSILVDKCKNIDFLINNAGDIPSGSLFDVNEDSWRRGWELKDQRVKCYSVVVVTSNNVRCPKSDVSNNHISTISNFKNIVKGSPPQNCS